MPRLRVLAGNSSDPAQLQDITQLVNTSKTHHVSSEFFVGDISVHMKGLTTEDGSVKENEDEYFEREDRSGVTWSIQAQGRFLQPISANDVLFGNTFDRPLNLPWGSGAVFKFMHYMDPTLEQDLASSTRPWALSPLITTMPYFAHSRLKESDESSSNEPDNKDRPEGDKHTDSNDEPKDQPESLPPFHPDQPITDDVTQLHLAVSSEVSAKEPVASSKESTEEETAVNEELQHANYTPAQRRAYFSDAVKRKQVIFGPKDVLSTDFAYGFMEFSPSLSLALPGGISFDLVRYWDGQPVRFVCCERGRKDLSDPNGTEEENLPWGKIFWCVCIELAE